MPSSASSDIFLEAILNFHENKSHLGTYLRKDILKERAESYSECINGHEDPLDSYIGLINGTKIEISLPGYLL